MHLVEARTIWGNEFEGFPRSKAKINEFFEFWATLADVEEALQKLGSGDPDGDELTTTLASPMQKPQIPHKKNLTRSPIPQSPGSTSPSSSSSPRVPVRVRKFFATPL